jgi:hypothetical protein
VAWVALTKERETPTFKCIATRKQQCARVHACGRFACTAHNALQQRTALQHSITSPQGVAASVQPRIAATSALEQKFRLAIGPLLKGRETQGGVMTTLQAMCFGAMLAWTPSLVVLALLLREIPLDEFQDDPS